MSRWSAVYEHFLDEDNDFRCTVPLDESRSCNSVIPKLKDGSTSANLKRHLKRHHRQTFESVSKKMPKQSKKKKCYCRKQKKVKAV